MVRDLDQSKNFSLRNSRKRLFFWAFNNELSGYRGRWTVARRLDA